MTATGRGLALGLLVLATGALPAQPYRGGVSRGPIGERRLALVFTGHEFAEGATTILDTLARHRLRASFFLTGDFLRTPAFAPIVERLVREGHDVGPHSDKHLLYVAWERPYRTLVDRATFEKDVRDNLRELERFGVKRGPQPYWIPPYEWFNADIVAWSEALGLRVATFTPGTRANADYTGEGDANFVSSQVIVDSIIRREREDPHGLNGFVLLMHVGAGPGRRDKLHDRLDEIVTWLRSRGYRFATLDELLVP